MKILLVYPNPYQVLAPHAAGLSIFLGGPETG
jgi:hypothetical protein